MKFLIREFPEELHRSLKIKAAEQGKQLYKLIIEILQKFISKEMKNGHKGE